MVNGGVINGGVRTVCLQLSVVESWRRAADLLSSTSCIDYEFPPTLLLYPLESLPLVHLNHWSRILTTSYISATYIPDLHHVPVNAIL